jgi:hypothetical protein
MTKDQWTAVVAAFRARLTAALPGFARSKEKCQDRVLYEWRPAEKLALFVMLVRDTTYDQITVDLAWSSKGKRAAGLYFNTDPIAVSEKDGAVVRLGMLFDRTRDVWWKATPDGVAEAVEKLLGHGVPYFRRVAEVKGFAVDWPGGQA